MKNFDLEVKIIQLAMKQAAGEASFEEINRLLAGGAIDWIKIRDLLSYHELGAVFYAMLKESIHLLPQKMANLLSHTFYWTLKNNLEKLKQFQRINQAFAREGLRILAMKGSALLVQFYAHLPVRPMADIDILLREEDYEKGSRVLEESGYKKELLGLKESYWWQRQCHLTFVKDREGKRGTILEAHWSLDFRRNGRLILEESWQRAGDIDTEFGRVGVLSPEDTLFSLALHQRRFGKVFCMKYILDTAFIFKKYGKQFDWDYFLSACGKYGLFSCAGFLLLQGKLFLDSSFFDAGLEKISLPKSKRAVMERFIANNLNSLQLGEKIKENYLKSHFLLYDTYREPVKYIINIPLEQFAKFHGLEPYKSRTKWLYTWRFIYSPFRVLLNFLTAAREKRGLITVQLLKELRRRAGLNLPCHIAGALPGAELLRERKGVKAGLSREGEGEPGLRVVRGWGWSMYPNIKDGDLVIIKRKEPRQGEVVCFKNDADTKTMHRVVKSKRGYLITKGDNCLCSDPAVKREEILGVAIAVRRGNRIIPIKGRWLYGYLYFLSGLIMRNRNLLKRIIMGLQELRVYSRMIRVIFPERSIEITRGAETENFYLIRARVHGREAATLKIDKKSCMVVYLYVKINYRKLGLESRLREEGLKLI